MLLPSFLLCPLLSCSVPCSAFFLPPSLCFGLSFFVACLLGYLFLWHFFCFHSLLPYCYPCHLAFSLSCPSVGTAFSLPFSFSLPFFFFFRKRWWTCCTCINDGTRTLFFFMCRFLLFLSFVTSPFVLFSLYSFPLYISALVLSFSFASCLYFCRSFSWLLLFLLFHCFFSQAFLVPFVKIWISRKMKCWIDSCERTYKSEPNNKSSSNNNKGQPPRFNNLFVERWWR